MKISLRPRYKQTLALLVLICVLFFLIQNSLKTWLAFSYAEGPQPGGLIKASEVEAQNPDYYFLIAHYLNEYESNSAKETILANYKKALTLSPFNYNYWFYLADYLYNEGNREKAIYTLNQAAALSPGTVSLRWRASMLAVKLNDDESMLDNLEAVVASDPNRRMKAYSLLWQSNGNAEEILKRISDDALPHYFYFLVGTKRINEAGDVVEKLRGLGYDTGKIAPIYVSHLINTGNIESAKNNWAATFGSWDGIWNGDFEEEPITYGFDWTTSQVDGATIKRSRESYRGDYSMKVDFDGKENVDFYHLRQVVPVDENSEYTLSSYVKSDGLTTGNGLQLQAVCLSSKDLYATSNTISGSNDWQPLSLSFETPEGCNTIVVRLRRNKSEKIDNLISGTLWIDDVQLKKTPNRL